MTLEFILKKLNLSMWAEDWTQGTSEGDVMYL